MFYITFLKNINTWIILDNDIFMKFLKFHKYLQKQPFKLVLFDKILVEDNKISRNQRGYWSLF